MRELAAALAAMLPQAAVGWADPATTPPGDQPIGAVALRRAEFAAGRAAVVKAMGGLGLPVMAVPMGADRAPVWPAGITGSITHTRAVALAAVTRGGVLGIDAELEGAVAPDLWETILTRAERAVVAGDPALATVIFCAKEAVYKAQYPVTGALFGFDRLEVTLDEGAFAARFTAKTGPIVAGTVWYGQYANIAGHIIAAIHIA